MAGQVVSPVAWTGGPHLLGVHLGGVAVSQTFKSYESHGPPTVGAVTVMSASVGLLGVALGVGGVLQAGRSEVAGRGAA